MRKSLLIAFGFAIGGILLALVIANAADIIIITNCHWVTFRPCIITDVTNTGTLCSRWDGTNSVAYYCTNIFSVGTCASQECFISDFQLDAIGSMAVTGIVMQWLEPEWDRYTIEMSRDMSNWFALPRDRFHTKYWITGEPAFYRLRTTIP